MCQSGRPRTHAAAAEWTDAALARTLGRARAGESDVRDSQLASIGRSTTLPYHGLVTGHPAISLPGGRFDGQRLVGLQIVGRRRETQRLLTLAAMMGEVIGRE